VSKETFKFAKGMMSNTRQTIGGYTNSLSAKEEKKEIITILKAKLSLDQLRQFAHEFGIEKEAENFKDMESKVEVEVNIELEREFKPIFEEVLEDEFKPVFETEQEEILIPKQDDKLSVTRADYFGVSIAIRDMSLKREIELKGVKEVKRANESIVEFAKDLAKKVRETKKDLGIAEDRENGF